MPTLEITTHLGCSLACRFCPQDRLVKSYPKGAPRDLSLGDFIRVLAKVPSHVRIDFSGMAEPWLNPDATNMAVHAFEQRRAVAIYTTLQGMRADDAAVLIDRFGDRISPETPWVVHLPDDRGAMTGWKPSAAYRATLGRFVAFQDAHGPDGLSFMTMSPDGRVAAAISDLVGFELAPFVGISRAENVDRTAFSPGQLLAAVRADGAVLCKSTPFFDHNTMLPNGDVVLCCMDYGRRHVLGNLLEASWAAIHAGPVMGGVRVQAMMPGPADGLLCRRCHHAAPLGQRSDMHWQVMGPTMWTDPVPEHREARREAPGAIAEAAPARRPRLRTIFARALHL